MNSRIVWQIVFTALVGLVVVATATTADLIHVVHASLLLALGVGALLGRPRTG